MMIYNVQEVTYRRWVQRVKKLSEEDQKWKEWEKIKVTVNHRKEREEIKMIVIKSEEERNQTVYKIHQVQKRK